MIEFRKISFPEEGETLLQIDGKIFADFPGDLFDVEDWADFESYWMLEDGAIVGCSAFIHHLIMTKHRDPAIFISSARGSCQRRAGAA